MKLNFYSDPGHGWLRVPVQLLDSWGLIDSITPFSHVRNNWAYLEEDRDAAAFLDKARELGQAVKLREINCAHNYSPIRNYASYNAARLRAQLAALWVPGLTVELYGTAYTLADTVRRRGWRVRRVSDGLEMLLPFARLAECMPLACQNKTAL